MTCEQAHGERSPATGTKLDVSALESWLWDAACQIRGPLDAPKFKDYILPLVFLKRLSDVFEDETCHLAEDFCEESQVLEPMFYSLLHHLIAGKVRLLPEL
jgi:HsdM N-terminal domain